MGMFDYVNFEMDCPTCGKPMRGFQSKDALCEMDLIEPDDLGNFYSSCRGCKTWVEFTRPRPQSPKRDKPLTLEQVKAMGFEMDANPRGRFAPDVGA